MLAEELRHISYQPHIQEEIWSQKTVASITNLIDYACCVDGKPTVEFSVLDVGCGRGELLRAVKDKGYVVRGVDIDPRCLEMSRRYAECLEADATQLAASVEGESVDMVILSHILEHLPDPGVVVTQAKVISRKWLVISVPNLCSSAVVLNNLIGRRSSMKAHLFGWDHSTMMNFLEYHCDLEIVHFDRGWVKVIPFDLLASRLPPKLARKSYSILNRIESKILARLFPRFSSNLTILCKSGR